MHSGLCLTLLSVAVLTVPIPAQPVPETFTLTVPDGPISSQSGSSVSLLCQVSPIFNIKPFEVKWYRSDDINKPTLLYKDHKIQEALMDPRFRGRVSLTGELERGDASLRLERVTLEDSGEFVCYIASNKWYEKARVVLAVSVTGSQPVISVAEARGGGSQVNVTCSSEGWSPQPRVTWRNKEGTEITNGQEVQNTTDSQGLVSVSSWLLYSPSESDWLSCIVFLSDEWKTEGRILPALPGGDSKKGFTVNQVLLVVLPVLFLVIIICALCFIIVFKRKGQIDQGLNVAETKRLIKENPVQSPANQTTSDNKDKLEENPVQSPANLTTTDNKDKPEENPVQSPANLTTIDNEDKPEENTVYTAANPTTADNKVEMEAPENPAQTPANLTTADNKVKPEGNTVQTPANPTTADNQVDLQGPENPVQSPANLTTTDNEDKLEGNTMQTPANPTTAENQVDLQGPENPVQTPANLTTTDNEDKPEENPVQSPANLTTTDNKDKPEGNTVQTPANPTTADNQVDLQGPENPVQSPANLTTTDNEDKLEDLLLGKKVKEEHITTDAKTASLAIRLSQKGKRVQYVKAKDKPDLQQSIHVLGNKGFDSGQHYWKVKIQDDDRKEEKLAWYLGVTKENAQCPLTPQNGFWVLFYEKEVGLHVYVDSVKTPTRQTTPTTVCVFLDCDKHTLSFYDADSGSLLYTFNDVKTTDTLYPVFSPGKRDPQPLKIY
ncbi:butyrophilin subfamily 3 member A1 isoform X1 [Esox lucius]|uniref:butyrophilin subfamily 3 member A1 isoform X1 n=1 Tax=Esox lucius TaxID=8010 RepID=UPI0014772A13|nr:butyrophilin subfamily 3 member A1 isoform X1 [Esox lucius]